jgi:hypothetical protein
MQTLISVFDDRADARRAMDKLVEAGFAHHDLHMQQADEEPVQEIQQNDRGVLDSLGHFMVSIFGADDGAKATGTYGSHYEQGHTILVVDARDDAEAETAAVILHDSGAIDVDDREVPGDAGRHPGVRMYQREAPALEDLAQQRQLREESLLADRAGQVTNDMKQDREERAYASAMNHTDRDRPK